MFEMLQKVKAKLAEMTEQNVAIGLESNLTANQCPFIRIIAMPSSPSNDNAFMVKAEVQILYGEKVNIKTNLENVYQKIYETEKNIKDKMIELEKEEKYSINWIETIPDEDTLQNLKASASIFEVVFSEGGYQCP